MMCKNPYMKNNVPHGCGQCLPCRINKRREWSHRILLESSSHESSTFVTLTYSPEELPEDMSLDPSHTLNFIKKLRKRLHPRKIRYFLVGEYGEETQRPHYHLAIFNTYPQDQEDIEQAWNKGHVMVGTLTHDSAQYIAGYVTKKLTQPDNEKNYEWREQHDMLLGNRFPEYARMSNRPGIGAHSMETVKDIMETDYGCDLMAELGDVPQGLHYGKKQRPLGRYLRSKIREKMDWKEKKTPEAVLQNLQLEYATEYSQYYKEAVKTPQKKILTQKQFITQQNKQKVRNLEGRTKIFKQRKKL